MGTSYGSGRGAAAGNSPKKVIRCWGEVGKIGSMKIAVFSFVALAASTAPALASTVLWADNFDAPDTTNFDGAATAGRFSGTLAGETYLRSWGFQQDINNNQLLMPRRGSDGVRFELATNDPTGGADDRYDWAGGGGGAAILGAGGFVVAFDWIPVENTLADWVSFQVGTINADNGNLTNDDYGILFRNNGDTERFDNGVNLGAGGSFTASAGGLVRQVEISYEFTSFADGTNVTATSTVDGVQVASDVFTWDANGGQMRMELGHLAENTRVDNLSISTIPEPSAAALFGLGIFGLLARRRR